MVVEAIDGLFALVNEIEDAGVREALTRRYAAEVQKLERRLETLYVRHYLEKKRARPRRLSDRELQMAHTVRCMRAIMPMMVYMSNAIMTDANMTDANMTDANMTDANPALIGIDSDAVRDHEALVVADGFRRA